MDPNGLTPDQYPQEFVPMVWGVGGWYWNNTNDLEFTNLPPGTTAVLGFNEPNFKGQANVSPEDAARAWPQVEALAQRHNLRLGGPAAAPGGDLMDQWSWWDRFFAAYPGARVDFMTSHYYGTSVGELKSMVDKMRSRYGNRPVWITEFAAPTTDLTTQLQFMQAAVSYLDSEPGVERYCWFSLDAGNGWLGPFASLWSSGALTSTGQVYATM